MQTIRVIPWLYFTLEVLFAKSGESWATVIMTSDFPGESRNWRIWSGSWRSLAITLFTVHALFLPKFVWKQIVHEHLTPMLCYTVSLPLSLLAWTNRETGWKEKTMNFMKLFWVSFCYWVIWGPRVWDIFLWKWKEDTYGKWWEFTGMLDHDVFEERDFLVQKAIFCIPEYCEIVDRQNTQ